MSEITDEPHYHVIEITGVMGVSRYERMVPCSRCDWGHLIPPPKSIDRDSVLEEAAVAAANCDYGDEASQGASWAARAIRALKETP